MPEESVALLSEYEHRKPSCVAFCTALHGLIQSLLDQEHQRVHSITWRVKEKHSLLRKICRPEKTYCTLDDVTDICGIRIITYFEDDVDKVSNIINREFSIDAASSVDKRAVLDPDRFGYLSLHYVAALTASRSQLTEYKRFSQMRAEIQIRSILQHTWAEIEHDLGYKHAEAVPQIIRRRFSRLASLLELADSEFASIRDSIAEYERELPSQIRTSADSVTLDRNSLAAYIRSSAIVTKIESKMARVYGVKLKRLSEERQFFASALVKELNFCEIGTVEQLDTALSAHGDHIVSFCIEWLAEGSKPDWTQGISMFYLAYLLVGAAGSVPFAIEYLEKLNIGTSDERSGLAKKIVEVSAPLGLAGRGVGKSDGKVGRGRR